MFYLRKLFNNAFFALLFLPLFQFIGVLDYVKMQENRTEKYGVFISFIPVMILCNFMYFGAAIFLLSFVNSVYRAYYECYRFSILR